MATQGSQQEPWPEGAVPMQEYFEALAVEQRRALEVAEREREKAAHALRENLREQMRSGDIALERHIDAQLESVKLALAAQEKFATEVQRSSKEATEKALVASNEMAHKHNDLIRMGERDKEKLASKEDLVYLRETIGRVEEKIGGTLPREVFDRTVEELGNWRVRTDEFSSMKIGRQEYDKAEDEWGEWKQSVEARMIRQEGQREGVGLSTRTITGLVSFAFIAVSLILVVGDVLTP